MMLSTRSFQHFGPQPQSGGQRLALFQGQHLRRREQGRLQRSRSVGCSTVDELIKAVRDDEVADSDVGRRVAFRVFSSDLGLL